MIGESVRTLGHIERIGAHTHIQGLGVSKSGDVLESDNGLVGQVNARKAMHLLSQMVEQNRTTGRIILLSGEAGTGKTALVMGLIKEIGNVPYAILNASEAFSSSISKAEALTQAIRKCIGVRVKEDNNVIEGEVVSIDVDRETGKSGRITLKTTDMEAVFELGERMIRNLNAEDVTPGDVISINKASNKATKLGRSLSRSKDYDSIGPKTSFVHCPEGDLTSVKEQEHLVSFHDIDLINSRSQGYAGIFAGHTGEISGEVREQVDGKMAEWIEEGRASLVTGVLFIDETHILDLECFSFLNTAAETGLSPIIILSSSKKMSKIRGTDIVSPYGMPSDLLDRLLIISTKPYTPEELGQIIQLRVVEEDCRIEDSAMEALRQLAEHRGLRYSLNVLTASSHISARLSREAIRIGDIHKAEALFLSELDAVAKLEK